MSCPQEYMLSRGKRKGTGEWIEGYFIPLTKIRFAITDEYPVNPYGGAFADKTFEFGRMSVTLYEIDQTTLGRCTGLRDKNGKLIWEGDLVEWDGQSMETYKIKYGDDASFYGTPINGKLEESSGESLSLLNSDLGLVVVGSIHDTPELLEA